MKDLIKTDWKEILEEEFKKDYFRDLTSFVDREYREETIYPAREDLFNALNFTSYRDTRVVIFGQDPYHGKNQAYGLAFSVKEGEKIPPSLRNIYKELEGDLGLAPANHGNLKGWADSGVLLLNDVLTVREKTPNSHRGQGWEEFTNSIVRALNDKDQPLVFILWGKNAYEKEALITNKRHHIIKSFHPSPFSASRGFFGSRPFSRANEFLESEGLGRINWKLEDI